ncbi:MAG: hypothetical protein C0592_12235 [Marinilabiliales bacterium]|nr:MAG: hypothetical protein C0592_12235 [Marinilabiliales bacterium]
MERDKRFTLTRKIITGILMYGFTVVGFTDILMHNSGTYSTTMAMDIDRVYFYTFFLLVLGSWLLYHRWYAGIGFICLAAFSHYFEEYRDLHNYFASITVYIGIVLDFLLRKKLKYLIPLIIIGAVQGAAFYYRWYGLQLVGAMEFLALSVGTVFIIKEVK